MDSASPVVASPESKTQIRLEEVEETDSRGLGVIAETPQFSPYASVQLFARKSVQSKRISDSDSSVFRPQTETQSSKYQADFDFLMDLSHHKETQTEPSPIPSQNTSIDHDSKSQSGRSTKEMSFGKYGRSLQLQNEDLARQLELVMYTMVKRELEVKREMTAFAERIGYIEDMGLRQREEVLETQDSLELTQRLLREIEGKVEGSTVKTHQETAQKFTASSSLSERVDALEKKEVSKLTLFEELGKELDVISP
jgi:hypothetical protein